ncbi:unnamed protein product [Ascophyllum nodosum]
MSGQVIAAIVVTAVAGNILAARRLRTTMAGMGARNAQRKEAERAFRETQEWMIRNASFSGNPLRGRVPEGWEFNDCREAAFGEQRLNSQVLQKLSTLGVKNFVADKDEVKAAYHRRAMNLHPDRSTDSALGGGTKSANQEEFKRVASAYKWLEENYYRKDP